MATRTESSAPASAIRRPNLPPPIITALPRRNSIGNQHRVDDTPGEPIQPGKGMDFLIRTSIAEGFPGQPTPQESSGMPEFKATTNGGDVVFKATEHTVSTKTGISVAKVTVSAVNEAKQDLEEINKKLNLNEGLKVDASGTTVGLSVTTDASGKKESKLKIGSSTSKLAISIDVAPVMVMANEAKDRTKEAVAKWTGVVVTTKTTKIGADVKGRMGNAVAGFGKLMRKGKKTKGSKDSVDEGKSDV